MAFKLYSTDDGHVPAWEYLPVDNIQTEVGLGLAFGENGKLVVSDIPTHICMHTNKEYVGSDAVLPVVKISEDQIWESGLYSAAASAQIGDKVDLSASGLWVDAASATNGNFQITYLEGTALNSVVRGRFV